MTKINKDIFLGFGLAVVFGIVLFAVIPNAIVVPSNIKTLSLRPDFWPGVLCVSLIFLSLLISGLSLFVKMRSEASPNGKVNKDTQEKRKNRFEAIKPYIVIGGLLVYYLLMEPLGIVLSSIFSLLGLALLYGERNLKVLIPLSILLPIGLYFFFTKIANIPLPVGSIFS